MADQIMYSERFVDDENTVFRYVILPPVLQTKYYTLTQNFTKLLSEYEWREILGITMTSGWEHYAFYPSKSSVSDVLLFRRYD